VPIGLLIWARKVAKMEANFSYGTPEEIVKIKESLLKEKLQLI
jgi:hypothetical protein